MLNLTIKNNGFDNFQNNPFEIYQKHISEFEKAINNIDLKVRNDDVSVISTFDDYPELFSVYKNINKKTKLIYENALSIKTSKLESIDIDDYEDFLLVKAILES